MVPLGPTQGHLRIPGGDEFALTWPPTQAGGTVDCTSIERVGRSVMISGEVRFSSDEAAPRAFVRCGRSYTWTDVMGRFELETWLDVGGEACSPRAAYQSGASGVSVEPIAVSLQSAHHGLTLTFADYPQWTPPTGASAAEAWASAAKLRAVWREELRPRPLSGVIAKTKRALSRTPPPCAEDDDAR